MAAPVVSYDTTYRAGAAPFAITVATADIVRNVFIGVDGAVCGAGAAALGVTAEAGAVGSTIQVWTDGFVPVLCGGNVAVGDDIVSDSAGKAVKATAFSATVPGSGTAVTSSSAQPAMTLAGSTLPQKILGRAYSAGSTTAYCLVKLSVAA